MVEKENNFSDPSDSEITLPLEERPRVQHAITKGRLLHVREYGGSSDQIEEARKEFEKALEQLATPEEYTFVMKEIDKTINPDT